MKNANLKLYVWQCELFNSEKWRLTLSALAENEEKAKNLLIQKVSTQAFREEILIFFAKNPKPSIYDEAVAFINSQGIPTLI